VAWDLDRDGWRTFRVDRVQTVVATGWRFEGRPLPSDDVASYVMEAFAAAPARYQGRVTFHARHSDIADRLRHIDGTVEPVDPADTTCVMRVKSDSLDWLAASIAVVGVDFEVHDPPELVDHVRSLASRLSAATPAPAAPAPSTANSPGEGGA
jgi:predicted DNA-binding transcriptional regulator YafY